MWDARTADGVDQFIAISRFVARRIRKVYRRTSTVIYPPVDVETFAPGTDRGDFYVTVSRFVPYKRLDVIVRSFSLLPDRQLVVIGDGPDGDRVRRMAGPNVTFVGRQPQEVVVEHLQHARAFLFAAEEDFGIVSVEAQACGTPVIAYGRGGSLETVRGVTAEDDPPGEDTTGVFYGEQSPSCLAAAVEYFERHVDRFCAEACRRQAERFSYPRFREEFRSFVEQQWSAFAHE
jgi:glycosyltransferase involved in cell wall biosynthesis